ncbi:MAG TPA: hypothetical protein VHW67_03240 [Solirubrobacteraceae bacterium]|nr:hypothetical protein [Solirubrobacteraceae bacterium]
MARQLRVEQALTVDQLAERMALPRSTIYYWVRDLPLGAPEDVEVAAGSDGPDAAGGASEASAAYEEGLRSFEELSGQPTFRDFICLYIVQGYKRDRARVALTNSDPAVMRLVSRWIRRLTDRVPFASVCFEDDRSQGQSLTTVRRFWGETIGVDERTIGVRRTPADRVLGAGGRTVSRGSPEAAPAVRAGARVQAPPRSRHGALTVTVEDTLLRARLQAWMQRTRESWQ